MKRRRTLCPAVRTGMRKKLHCGGGCSNSSSSSSSSNNSSSISGISWDKCQQSYVRSIQPPSQQTHRQWTDRRVKFKFYWDTDTPGNWNERQVPAVLSTRKKTWIKASNVTKRSRIETLSPSIKIFHRWVLANCNTGTENVSALLS
jgi:hypothetical protein